MCLSVLYVCVCVCVCGPCFLMYFPLARALAGEWIILNGLSHLCGDWWAVSEGYREDWFTGFSFSNKLF